MCLLPVVFFLRNVAAGAVLLAIQFPPLFLRYHAVRLRLFFMGSNAALLLLQPGGFALVQLPARDALVDTLLLALLPGVDLRGIRLSIDRDSRCRCDQTDE